jgi:Ni/Co efflux regulator RcnB
MLAFDSFSKGQIVVIYPQRLRSPGQGREGVLALENPMKLLRLIAVGLTALALGTGTFAAPPEGKGKPDKGNDAAVAPASKQNGNGDKGGKAKDDADWEYRYHNDFNENDFRVFVREQHYSGYDSLPPGIRKNLARGKPLPPGIAKRQVPPEMLRRLPVRAGYEWRAVGTDLVLYSITSGIVDQVLQNVFFE